MKTCVAQPVDAIVADAEKELYAQHKLYRKYGKRAFDLLSSAVGLLILLPVFLILSIWIFAYDRGPVLYKQARIGRGGKPFGVYKFRTMVVNADQIGPLSTGDHDPRITAPGRFLRKTSLDELPQLLNVLLGDMSLVGYRPNVSDLIDWSDEAYLRLLCMRPGITGYAQVYGRSNNTYESAMEKNTRYLREVSFGTDLKLIFLTAARVFGGAAEAN